MFNSSLALFQDSFGYWGPFWFCMNFRIAFSIFIKNAVGVLMEARGWWFPANHTVPCQGAAFGEPVSPFCLPFHCCCFHTPLEYSSWLVSAYLTKGTDLCVAFELMCWGCRREGRLQGFIQHIGNVSPLQFWIIWSEQLPPRWSLS